MLFLFYFSKLGGAVRVVFGRKSVEPKVKEALRSQNVILSQLFELSKCELESNSHQDCPDDQNIAHASTEDKIGVSF